MNTNRFITMLRVFKHNKFTNNKLHLIKNELN